MERGPRLGPEGPAVHEQTHGALAGSPGEIERLTPPSETPPAGNLKPAMAAEAASEPAASKPEAPGQAKRPAAGSCF